MCLVDDRLFLSNRVTWISQGIHTRSKAILVVSDLQKSLTTCSNSSVENSCPHLTILSGDCMVPFVECTMTSFDKITQETFITLFSTPSTFHNLCWNELYDKIKNKKCVKPIFPEFFLNKPSFYPLSHEVANRTTHVFSVRTSLSHCLRIRSTAQQCDGDRGI